MSGDNESLESPWRGGIHGEASVHPSYEGDEYDVSGQGGRRQAKEQEDPHDLVIRDLLSRDPRWDVSVGSARHIRDRVADDLLKHKVGKVGAYRNLLTAVVDLRRRLLEIDESSLEYLVLVEVYDDVLAYVVRVRRVLDAATE
jgi:hypothetical protein